MTARGDMVDFRKVSFPFYMFEIKKWKFILLVECCFSYWIIKMSQSVKNNKMPIFQSKSIDFY